MHVLVFFFSLGLIASAPVFAVSVLDDAAERAADHAAGDASSEIIAETTGQHETVLVEATRLAADDIDTGFQSGRVTVLEGKDFENDVATVADVLRNQPGVQVRRVGGLGSYSAVSIRGSTSAQVNVYLDGILVNDAFGGSVDLSQFLLSAVERIEVYRGNVPIQLGASNIGGAINIKTKRSSGETANQLSIGYGSFKSRKASLTSSGAVQNTHYLASVEWLDSDNDYEFLNDNQTPSNPNDDRTERRQNSQFEQSAALLSLSRALNEHWDASFLAQYSDKRNGVVETNNDPSTRAFFDVENLNLQLKLDQALDARTALSYQLYGGFRRSLYNDTLNQVGLGANLEEAQSDTIGSKIDYMLSVGNHLVRAGLKTSYEDYESEDQLRNQRVDAQRFDTTLSLQDEWLNAQGDLLLTGRVGVRSLQDERTSGMSDKKSGTYVDAHIGARYELDPATTLFANLSRDIRAPGLQELFGDEGAVIGNDTLVEESAINADVGAEMQFNQLGVQLGAFNRQLEDAIVVIYDSRGIGRAENVSEAEIYGLELEAKYQISTWWQIDVIATVQRSEDRSTVRSFNGNPLPGQFEQQASIKNIIILRGVRTELEYQHRSGGYYDRSATTAMPDSDKVNLNFGYAWSSHRAQLALKNITDEKTEEFNRYPGPGRSAFLTYSYTF